MTRVILGGAPKARSRRIPCGDSGSRRGWRQTGSNEHAALAQDDNQPRKDVPMDTIYENESTPKKDGYRMPGEFEPQEC
ncbi:MAG: hypothetical protein ACLU0V_02870, partial [Eggerthella lenta]